MVRSEREHVLFFYEDWPMSAGQGKAARFKERESVDMGNVNVSMRIRLSFTLINIAKIPCLAPAAAAGNDQEDDVKYFFFQIHHINHLLHE